MQGEHNVAATNPTKTPLLESLAERFICPISQDIMVDPVVAADGYTYERSCIAAWIDSRGGRAISPLTGEPLAHREITANTTLLTIIKEYQEIHPQIRQHELTKNDIFLAISLHEKELNDRLAKRNHQISTLDSELEASQSQIGPLEAELARQQAKIATLEEQQQHLETILAKRTLTNGDDAILPTDKTLQSLIIDIGQLEAQAVDLQETYASNRIKHLLYQRALVKLLQASKLDEAQQVLQADYDEVLAKKDAAISAIKESVEQAMQTQDFEQGAELMQQAASLKSEFDNQLAKLEGDIDVIIERKKAKAAVLEEKDQQLMALSQSCTEQRSELISLRHHQALAADNLNAYLLAGYTSTSRQLAQAFIMTNNRLSRHFYHLAPDASREVAERQAMLTDACQQGIIINIKELMESGADLFVTDRNGVLPLGAAVWGCQLRVIRYLVEGATAPLACLDKGDWQAVVDTNTAFYQGCTDNEITIKDAWNLILKANCPRQCSWQRGAKVLMENMAHMHNLGNLPAKDHMYLAELIGKSNSTKYKNKLTIRVHRITESIASSTLDATAPSASQVMNMRNYLEQRLGSEIIESTPTDETVKAGPSTPQMYFVDGF